MNSTLHFIFQPGEKDGAGAKAMMEDYPRKMAVYRRQKTKASNIGVRAGPVMAGGYHQDHLPKYQRTRFNAS